MDKVATVIRLLILVLCVLLFLAGALWNLCVQPEQTAETSGDMNRQEDYAKVALISTQENEMEYEETAIRQSIMENRIAELRMERDNAWQQLYHTVAQLEFTEKQQTLQQYAELQYCEQKLELLLSAKGIVPALAILGQEQANLIVPADILQQEYEKLYDLVLRNTEYDETQIILVPLK
ncbi:MAG: hypothetical protein IJB37_02635 [Peptococcaceae bacterium]|nr:hypothetical protein [Peptococcaceae bacterium]